MTCSKGRAWVGDVAARELRQGACSRQIASSIRFTDLPIYLKRSGKMAKWLLNYARNANNPIPVAFATTTTKVNAP
jgi:hypothetical protein